MKNLIFKGVCTALVTPFKNGGVDYSALKLLLDRQIEAGIEAVVVLGTTGEPCCIDESEREKIIKTTVDYCSKRIKVLVGCGSNNTKKAIDNYIQAQSLGADGALIVTPYYNKCTQDGIIEYYSQISKVGTLPIIAYNVPSRTGVNIEVNTAKRLIDIANICGIKEASGNIGQIVKYFDLIAKDIAIYSGDDMLNFVFMALGGAGTISVLSNLLPKETKDVITACFKYDYKNALEIQHKLNFLIDKLFIEVNPIPIKASLEYLGLCDGDVRSPLTRISSKNFDVLKQEINKYWNNYNDSM